eukprot:scaffold4060_cov17-Tisochrysis_lutea.AAC.1
MLATQTSSRTNREHGNLRCQSQLAFQKPAERFCLCATPDAAQSDEQGLSTNRFKVSFTQKHLNFLRK